jgi:hypothetical protein
MAIVKDIIRTALRYCGQETNYDSADDDTYEDGISKLNQLWQMWYQLNLDISAGQIELDSLSGSLNVPEWAVPAFEYNLAKMLWPLYNFGVSFPMALEYEAKNWENKLFTIAGTIPKSVYPGTLPVGTGQNWSADSWNYYPDCDPVIYPNGRHDMLTEGDVNIITEGANEH